MILKYYAIRDKQVEAFLSPFSARTDGEAIRMFSNAIQDKNTEFSRHPGDFDLYLVADWNDQIGSFTPTNGGARRVISALECGVLPDA